MVEKTIAQRTQIGGPLPIQRSLKPEFRRQQQRKREIEAEQERIKKLEEQRQKARQTISTESPREQIIRKAKERFGEKLGGRIGQDQATIFFAERELEELKGKPGTSKRRKDLKLQIGAARRSIRSEIKIQGGRTPSGPGIRTEITRRGGEVIRLTPTSSGQLSEFFDPVTGTKTTFRPSGEVETTELFSRAPIPEQPTPFIIGGEKVVGGRTDISGVPVFITSSGKEFSGVQSVQPTPVSREPVQTLDPTGAITTQQATKILGVPPSQVGFVSSEQALPKRDTRALPSPGDTTPTTFDPVTGRTSFNLRKARENISPGVQIERLSKGTKIVSKGIDEVIGKNIVKGAISPIIFEPLRTTFQAVEITTRPTKKREETIFGTFSKEDFEKTTIGIEEKNIQERVLLSRELVESGDPFRVIEGSALGFGTGVLAFAVGTAGSIIRPKQTVRGALFFGKELATQPAQTTTKVLGEQASSFKKDPFFTLGAIGASSVLFGTIGKGFSRINRPTSPTKIVGDVTRRTKKRLAGEGKILESEFKGTIIEKRFGKIGEAFEKVTGQPPPKVTTPIVIRERIIVGSSKSKPTVAEAVTFRKAGKVTDPFLGEPFENIARKAAEPRTGFLVETRAIGKTARSEVKPQSEAIQRQLDAGLVSRRTGEAIIGKGPLERRVGFGGTSVQRTENLSLIIQKEVPFFPSGRKGVSERQFIDDRKGVIASVTRKEKPEPPTVTLFPSSGGRVTILDPLRNIEVIRSDFTQKAASVKVISGQFKGFDKIVSDTKTTIPRTKESPPIIVRERGVTFGERGTKSDITEFRLGEERAKRIDVLLNQAIKREQRKPMKPFQSEKIFERTVGEKGFEKTLTEGVTTTKEPTSVIGFQKAVRDVQSLRSRRSEESFFEFGSFSEISFDRSKSIGFDESSFVVQETAPLSRPITQPITQPLTQPLTQTVTRPITQPITRPITQPLTQTVTRPVTIPVTKPITQPITKPLTQPLTQTVTRPVTIPVTKPITQIITRPVTKPITTPTTFPTFRRTGIPLIEKEKEKTKRKIIGGPGFVTELLRGGKVVETLPGVFTRKEAFARGQRETDLNRLLRSFRLRRTDQLAVPRGIRGLPEERFRRSKRDPSIIVERAKFSLSSPREIGLIQFARGLTRKRKNNKDQIRSIIK